MEEILRICKISNNRHILAKAVTIIVAMIPCASDLHRYHQELAIVPVEKYMALPILKRVKIYGFSHLQTHPPWREDAITVLSLSDKDLLTYPDKEVKEFVDKFYLFRELHCEVLPDHIDVPNVKGLLFSIR